MEVITVHGFLIIFGVLRIKKSKDIVFERKNNEIHNITEKTVIIPKFTFNASPIT